MLFASVIEPHGYFNEARERSAQARPRITGVNVLGHSDVASVVEITGQEGLHWRIVVSNQSEGMTGQQEVTFGDQSFQWTGNFQVEFLGNPETEN